MRRRYRKFLVAALALLAVAVIAFRGSDRYFEMAKSLDIMAAAYRDLNEYYVDSIDPSRLMQTGIEAMTESLDPYTYYFSQDNLGDLDFQTTGKYGGVGTSIDRVNDSVVVTDVLEGAPFATAGIRPGDVILSIDGISCDRMSMQQISDLLKGTAGSGLDLLIRHPFAEGQVRYRIRREEVNVDGVAYAGMAADSIGYIKMIQFTRGVAGEMARTVKKLEKEHPHMKGLILDLRGNPGGLLEEAVKIANLFLPVGDTILSTRGRVSEWNRVYRATRMPLDSTIPLAVLTNDHTASASEIVAGAMQDLDRGIIVGQRSFGKGLVQTTRSLPYQGKIKITTAKYYTPSGRCIQAIDYAHRSDDGSVTHIPDSMKKAFYTRNGRKVMNDGGIEPDKYVEGRHLSRVAISLINHHLIFDFATRYVHEHPVPPEEGKFTLPKESFNRFMAFLREKNYSYKSQTERALDQFREAAEKEGDFSAVDPDYQALRKAVGREKTQVIRKHKQEISLLLETEIMSRFYFQKGRVAERLPSDPVVQAAVSLLGRQDQYRELLKGPRGL